MVSPSLAESSRQVIVICGDRKFFTCVAGEVNWSEILTDLAGDQLQHLQIDENSHCALQLGEQGPTLQIWNCNTKTDHPVVFSGEDHQTEVSAASSCPANQAMQYEDGSASSVEEQLQDGRFRVQVMFGEEEFAAFAFRSPVTSMMFAWHFNEFLTQMSTGLRIGTHGFEHMEDGRFRVQLQRGADAMEPNSSEEMAALLSDGGETGSGETGGVQPSMASTVTFLLRCPPVGLDVSRRVLMRRSYWHIWGTHKMRLQMEACMCFLAPEMS